MSQPIRWSVSVDAETQVIADKLQREFAPFLGRDKRSPLVCLIFKMPGLRGFIAEHLTAKLKQCPLPLLDNSSQSLIKEFPSAAPKEGRAKPPKRLHTRDTNPLPLRGIRFEGLRRWMDSYRGPCRADAGSRTLLVDYASPRRSTVTVLSAALALSWAAVHYAQHINFSSFGGVAVVLTCSAVWAGMRRTA